MMMSVGWWFCSDDLIECPGFCNSNFQPFSKFHPFNWMHRRMRWISKFDFFCWIFPFLVSTQFKWVFWVSTTNRRNRIRSAPPGYNSILLACPCYASVCILIQNSSAVTSRFPFILRPGCVGECVSGWLAKQSTDVLFFSIYNHIWTPKVRILWFCKSQSRSANDEMIDPFPRGSSWIG